MKNKLLETPSTEYKPMTRDIAGKDRERDRKTTERGEGLHVFFFHFFSVTSMPLNIFLSAFYIQGTP